ncbi:MAG: hypothetical protein JXR46_09455 [Calditrichaceae bacterium]|nr:hypothetical protein [Calditrichaceae bacterium]MBN2709258.1 hypothetical protein [Calditrichaceae bacterium]RQV96211.1 MAG: hypothetical protein EH224_05765 [Calditrichota bacterium]
MMQAKIKKGKFKKLCDILGEDLDSPACRQIIDNISNSPPCKVYYDTVKKSVLLCKQNDCVEEVPNGVNKRLLKILDLEEEK